MPTIEIAGKQIETTEMGYLVNAEDWSKDLAQAIADSEKLELTERHWDVINHLRDEFFNNAGNQPNTRKLVKFFENLIQLVNIIGSIFYGTILGIFLVAIFIKKVKGKAIFWAAVISEAIIIVIFFKDIVGFLWLNLFGTILTISLGLIFQNSFNKKQL